MTDIEADLMIANAEIKRLQSQLAEYDALAAEYGIDGKTMLTLAKSQIRTAQDNIKLREQLAASQRRAQDARNELCQKCGRYHEAHNGACDGCRWKENSDGFEALLERWGNGDSDNAVCATALAAPREQAERSKGCEYCRLETHQVFDCDTCHLVKDRCDNQEDSCYGIMYIQIENEYCPMCGKRLEATHEQN